MRTGTLLLQAHPIFEFLKEILVRWFCKNIRVHFIYWTILILLFHLVNETLNKVVIDVNVFCFVSL